MVKPHHGVSAISLRSWSVSVLILVASIDPCWWHTLRVGVQETSDLLFLSQNIAGFIFTPLALMSPTSIVMLVVWCANTIVMSINLVITRTKK